MQNTFIIKNADETFDAYYQHMRKRKLVGHGTMEHSMIGENKFGIVHGRKPTARDGHSANVNRKGYMFIFGGDRHHMPFNDLYMIKLPK
jgi:hypothetical protein